LECKTSISAAEEITRIMTIRIKEIATLLSRTTITSVEKTKLTAEETEIKEKLETQSNVIVTQTKNLSTYESNLTTLTSTITTFKKYITEITTVIKTLEKKVKETK
jgi:chromosome segregation ATPase